MNRDEAVSMWRAGFTAGARSANRHAAEELDRTASYLAACRTASAQAQIDALLLELIAALVPLFDEPACEVCPGCRHALSHGSVRCPRCDAGAAGWPGERREAA